MFYVEISDWEFPIPNVTQVEDMPLATRTLGLMLEWASPTRR